MRYNYRRNPDPHLLQESDDTKALEICLKEIFIVISRISRTAKRALQMGSGWKRYGKRKIGKK